MHTHVRAGYAAAADLSLRVEESPPHGAERAWLECRVVYHDFVLTTKNYIRMVLAIRGEWLVDVAPHYYDMATFPDGSAKRALEKLHNKVARDKSSRF